MRALWLLAVGTMIATAMTAQAPSVYPAKGQSAEQMNKDKGECHVWAVSESGFDPTASAAPPPTIVVEQPKQQAVGGRARGAARGAVIGEAVGNDPGAGAAAGAVVGGSRQRRANRAPPATSEQPNPDYQKYQQDKARYDGAVKACLTGRGYTLG